VLLVSGKEAKYYRVSENEITHLKSTSVELPNKHHKGGQSSVRFARLVVEKRDLYVKKMAETVMQYFTKNGKSEVETLILAGPGEMKAKVKAEVQHLFKIQMIETAEIKDNTIQDVVKKCDLRKDEQPELDKFHEMLRLNPDILTFGKKEVEKALKVNALQKVYISSEVELDGVELVMLRDEAFKRQYGMVGVRWFAYEQPETSEDELDE